MGALITWFTGSRFALTVGKWAAIALTITLFLLSLRRSGERVNEHLKLTRFRHLNLPPPLWRKAPSRAAFM
ncbi:hypothetical protein [Profundibacter sp.]|uniref:hypothetical protein n=1 Tax=Profundibacter sp. TaxID=3101071 RepID=UPI003D0C5773